MIEIADYILRAAKSILDNGKQALPAQIPEAPTFYIAEENDQAVLAYGTVFHERRMYKIGVLRQQQSSIKE
ncbi:hypothetical protein AAG895_01210 [Thauera sp. JM12B12]|uniref:hypothetical protein n=1 Tax=Thauera sp. JM12B12 TaxID=3142262 RepID=UPI0031F47595